MRFLLPVTALALAHAPAQLDEVLARARPTPAEERWRLVPWQASLTAALAKARAHDRPVFLFTYDGTLDDGNC